MFVAIEEKVSDVQLHQTPVWKLEDRLNAADQKMHPIININNIIIIIIIIIIGCR